MNYTKQISCDRKKHNYIRQGFTVADLEANKSSRTGIEKDDCGELQSRYEQGHNSHMLFQQYVSYLNSLNIKIHFVVILI